MTLCLRIPNIDILNIGNVRSEGEKNSSTYNICQVVYKNDVCIAYREIDASA